MYIDVHLCIHYRINITTPQNALRCAVVPALSEASQETPLTGHLRLPLPVPDVVQDVSPHGSSHGRLIVYGDLVQLVLEDVLYSQELLLAHAWVL